MKHQSSSSRSRNRELINQVLLVAGSLFACAAVSFSLKNLAPVISELVAISTAVVFVSAIVQVGRYAFSSPGDYIESRSGVQSMTNRFIASLIFIAAMGTVAPFVVQLFEVSPTIVIGIACGITALIAGSIPYFTMPASRIRGLGAACTRFLAKEHEKAIMNDQVAVRRAGTLLLYLSVNMLKDTNYVSANDLNKQFREKFSRNHQKVGLETLKWRMASLLTPSVAESVVLQRIGNVSPQDEQELQSIWPVYAKRVGVEGVDLLSFSFHLRMIVDSLLKANRGLVEDMAKALKENRVIDSKTLESWRQDIKASDSFRANLSQCSSATQTPSLKVVA